MAYAILRVGKIKAAGARGLAAVSGHIARTRSTPNADPAREVRVLVGLNPEADVMRLLPEHRRRDATVAMEFVLSASPEYFRPLDPSAAGTWEAHRLDAWVSVNLDWLTRAYGNRLAHACLHLDESTPHIQALVIPLDAKEHLNARDLFSPAKLRQLQSEYGKAMEPLGLQRGIEGSKARHEPIRQYYARVNCERSEPVAVPEVRGAPPAVPEPAVGERLSPKAYAERAAQRAYEAGFREGSRATAEALRPRLAKAREFDATRKRLKEREDKLDELRKQADRLREIPLREVFLALDCGPDPKDPKFNWRTPAGRVSTNRDNPAQWFNHDQQHGGGGAIDLAMHLGGFTLKEAVAWLAAHFGSDITVSSACAQAVRRAEEQARSAAGQPAPSEIPAVSSASIGIMKDYLIKRRALPEALVEYAIKQGAVFAARYGSYVNVAFRLVAPEDLDGDSTGVELRGSGETSYHGVRGRKGVFRVGRGQCRELAVCESAIEAMSYYALHHRPGLWVIGTAGDSGAGIEVAVRLAATGIKIVAAQNSDAAGERQARRLLKAVPGAVRHLPQEADDWNELLQVKAWANCFAPAKTAALRHTQGAPAVRENPLFIQIANRWAWAEEPEKTAITDHGTFLAVNDAQDEVIRFALELANALWGSITVTGSEEFRRAAWRRAALMDIDLAGYPPDDSDQIWLQEQQRSAHADGLAEPAASETVPDEELAPLFDP